jgi:protein-L-isoaspartate O-methyltransferase
MRRLALILTLAATAAFAQKPGAPTLNGQASTDPDQSAIPESLAPYLPTPNTIVDQMLQAVHLKAGETLFDLGSGDGRIVIAAARKYKANAIGVELDDELAASSISRIAESGLEKNARIIHGDLMQQDYSKADVVTVYLWPEANKKVAALLDIQLKKGARVVSHDFEMGTWKPTQTITIPDDGTGRSHTLFVYIR